jgi:hypothetical protein
VAVHEDAPDKLTVVQTITTAAGARTMAVDPATHRLYTVTQDFAAADASATAPGRGRGAPVPDTLRVLVYGTK